MNARLPEQLDLLANAPGGVARLRELILTLAVRGLLVPQNPNDDPVRLDAAAPQVLRLIDEGKVPRGRAGELIEDRSDESELPIGWAAVRGSDVFIPRSGNSKLIKGKLFSEAGEGLYAGYSASGQDVWLSSFEYSGTAVILSAVGARCGKAFLARGKWSAIANTHIVWPLEGIVTAEYAMLLLNDENFWIRSGGAQPFLKVTETLQRTVLIPPLREQTRIVARVDELMQLCDALDAKGQLEAQQHARLVETLLGTLTDSATPEELKVNWQRVAEHFDLLLDRPEAVDALEQTVLQLAVRGLLVPQDPSDEPASVLLERIRSEKDRLIAAKRIRRTKPLSAITGAEHPYDLPATWEWARLGDLGDWGAGATPSRANSAYYGGSIPWLKSGELTTDFISESEESVTEAALKDCSLRLNLPGDVLIAMYGATIGKTGILSVTATSNQAVCACTPFEGLINTYLLLVLKALKPHFISLGAGGAQPNISREKIISTVIGLPPLAEQSRIVARVDELRRLCADLRQRLAAVQTTQSRLAEALVETATW